MGVSSSSLLDEAKSNYIKGQAEAALKEFKPYYTKQFSVARFAQAEDDLEQNKQKITQLLKQRESSQEAAILYEDSVLYFDDTRKWRDRYVVVRANYCLECHDSLETFVKGVPPRQKLLPTGGTVLTNEDSYMSMVDKCFPDDGAVKEDFVPPLSGMPGQFPVYLRLPYRRDSYFCFRQEVKQKGFLSILSDCIRHQNQDFLKKKTCEVQAFLKAIQLYRQDKGKFQAWDMLIGSDVRVMANLVMEQLLPSLEKDMLPRLKAKKTEKKRVWFATVEAAYILVQEQLLSGLTALKEECAMSVRQQEVLIHSDMDQILEARKQLEEKIQAKVSGSAEKLCSEAVQPYLGSVLEELMEPISSGFQEGRKLSEDSMDEACHSVLQGGTSEELKKALASMARPDLQSCYQKIGSLQEKLQQLQERFGFFNVTGMIHSAQIDLQQLMENAAFTFELMLQKAVQDHPEDPDNAASAIEKAKHRILKQYDYDSSSVRKRIFQDALVSITLPFLKKNLASTYKAELQDLQQLDSDHSAFIHVDNIYEDVLLQTLDKEVTKVVKEAASLKKYNLVADSRDLLSQSSRSSLSSPAASTPSSPSMVPAAAPTEPQSPSPLAVNGLSSMSPTEVNKSPKEDEEVDASVPEAELPVSDVFQTVKAEPESPSLSLVPPQSASAPAPSAPSAPSAPETVNQDQVDSEQKEQSETAAEPEMKKEEAEISLSESSSTVGTVQTNPEAAGVEAPEPSPGPEPLKEADTPLTEGTGPDPELCKSSTEEPGPGSELETSPDPPQEADEPLVEGPGSDAEPGASPESVSPSADAPGPDADPEPEPSPGSDAPKEADNTSLEGPGPEPEASPVPDPQKEAEKPSIECPDPEPSLVPDPVESACSDPVSPSNEGSGPDPESVNPSSEATEEEQLPCEVLEVQLVAPSSDVAAADVQLKGDELEPGTVSDPNSLDVSVGSESPPSDLGSTDDVSTTSDVLEEDATLSRSPVSSDEPSEDKAQRDECSPPDPTPTTPQVEEPAHVRAGADVEAGASVEVEDAGATSPPSEPVREEAAPPEAAGPLDSVKEIRELVAEVIEVDELVQRYPDGIPMEE